MKNILFAAALGGALLTMSHARADERRDLYADTWVATDALNRALPLGGEVRAPQPDKFVGIFYFVWQGFHGHDKVYDMTKILAADPNNPQWGPKSAFHWWGEPEVGYYRATDPWVARRNLQMLAVAGVDCLSNRFSSNEQPSRRLSTPKLWAPKSSVPTARPFWGKERRGNTARPDGGEI